MPKSRSPSKRIQTQLADAVTARQLVRVYRESFEDGSASGFVVATGPEFFGLEIVDENIQLNGYQCMRYADVSRCDIPHPFGAFYEKALTLRHLQPQGNPGVDVSSVSSLIRSASTLFPVLTVHLEEDDPDVCSIGGFVDIWSEHLVLKPINAHGQWEDDLETYALSEITRVDFGGGYEEALVLAANADP